LIENSVGKGSFVPIGSATNPKKVKLNPQFEEIFETVRSINKASNTKRALITTIQTIAENNDNFRLCTF
jgi:hypothetical protein